MSDLTNERDWMRKCADNPEFDEPTRELWKRLADEIDEYLGHDDQEGLFA